MNEINDATFTFMVFAGFMVTIVTVAIVCIAAYGIWKTRQEKHHD